MALLYQIKNQQTMNDEIKDLLKKRNHYNEEKKVITGGAGIMMFGILGTQEKHYSYVRNDEPKSKDDKDEYDLPNKNDVL